MPTATEPKTHRVVRFEAPAKRGPNLIVSCQEEIFDSRGKVRPVAGTGKRITFQPTGDGQTFYETRDPEEIEWLRNHPQRATGNFIEVPVAVPPSAPVIAEVLDLALARDSKALAKMYDEEEQGHQRQDVMDALTKALTGLEKG